jgi:hypothetical protein
MAPATANGRSGGLSPLLPVLVLSLALAAFLAGQLVGAGEGSDRRGAPAARATGPAREEAARWFGAPHPTEAAAERTAPQAPTAVWPTGPTPGSQAPRATPELTAAAVAEAGAQLETLRAYIDERCWPAGGLRSGRATAPLQLNLTFDAEGREIARGISEDRRAPAGDFTRCLRRLGGTTLRIAPRGITVAMTLPVTFP